MRWSALTGLGALLVLSASVGRASAQGLQDLVRLDTRTMTAMLDFQNRQTDKELILLRSRFESAGYPFLVLGAQARGSVMLAQTNTPDKYPFLGRFPSDFTERYASDARITQANVAVAAHANSWVTAYFETLFSDTISFPTFDQGSFQMRQLFVVVGDLEASPWYAYLGKRNTPFGDLRTVSPFTQSVPWHYFAGLAEGVGTGTRTTAWTCRSAH